MAEDLATARQAATIVGVSERRIRQLAEDGTLQTVETSPLRVSVAACLRLRESRDDKKAAEPESPATTDLRSIVSEVASAMLPAALEAAAHDRKAADSARDRAEDDLRAALAAAELRAKVAEDRVSELEGLLTEKRKGLFRRKN